MVFKNKKSDLNRVVMTTYAVRSLSKLSCVGKRVEVASIFNNPCGIKSMFHIYGANQTSRTHYSSNLLLKFQILQNSFSKFCEAKNKIKINMKESE